MAKVLNNLQELDALVGQELGVSEWMTVSQEMINQFAEATGDHQWIHTDVERAKTESPFGGPIAHGFLTLSLASHLLMSLLQIKSVKMGMNYGLNKVRFTGAVPAGSRVRMHARLLSSDPYAGNGRKFVAACNFELEGQEKPVCVAEFVALSFE
ncbi:MAG: MaoC family dehydratase [Bacteroidota bacterium]